jgi:hypothetical protein
MRWKKAHYTDYRMESTLMADRYTIEDHQAYRAEQDEKARKKQQELDEKMEKATARNAWLAGGGNPDTFETEWPRLRRELQSARVAKAGELTERARQGQRFSGISSI